MIPQGYWRNVRCFLLNVDFLNPPKFVKLLNHSPTLQYHDPPSSIQIHLTFVSQEHVNNEITGILPRFNKLSNTCRSLHVSEIASPLARLQTLWMEPISTFYPPKPTSKLWPVIGRDVYRWVFTFTTAVKGDVTKIFIMGICRFISFQCISDSTICAKHSVISSTVTLLITCLRPTMSSLICSNRF